MYPQKTINAWANEFELINSRGCFPYLEIGICLNQQYPEGYDITLAELVRITDKVDKQLNNILKKKE